MLLDASLTNEPLVSVVIAFYNNASKYENILIKLSELPDFVAVTCIDDGSTDDTLEILNKYSSRFNIIHQDNKGVFGAYTTGIRNATGIYIHCIDADDDLDISLYSDIKKVIDTNISPDLFIFPRYSRKKGKDHFIKLKLPKGLFTITPENFFKYVQPDNYHKIDGFRWNKIFKREVIQPRVLEREIYNDKIKFFEDFLHTFPAMCNVKTAYNLDKAYYYYVIVSGSASHSPSMCDSFFDDEKKIFPYFKEVLEESGINSKKLDYYRYMSYAACYYFLVIYKRKDLQKRFRHSYFYRPYSRFLLLHHPFFYITYKLRLNFLLRIHAKFYIFM